MFGKLLVANRGEIAIRAFRAAVELGLRTVAVYAHEDRFSLHRMKADESYQIGKPGHPLRAYLTIEEIIRVAKMSGADAIYPGYGFLSENPELARACERAGIIFVGPGASVLEMAGNKVTAKEHALSAGVPVLASSDPSTDLDSLVAASEAIGFPIFAKAVAGGGGRGMRKVENVSELRPALEAATREAETAFGDGRLFLEQAVSRPRHIEVQILADKHGGILHLHERDCSVQRRHQKVIEIAPAPALDESIKKLLFRDAIAFAKSIGYENAGTVEFLVDTEGERAGQHVFIEMNPRIQVEHTVTEEITDVDLVQTQLRIASGESFGSIGLSQDDIQPRGFAMQCRITTEDPASDFRPDTGKITTYRSPGGAGIRLDGGTVSQGALVSPYFDSMLAKMTTRGRTFEAAAARARRGLAEFRIRGVATNIPFLQAVVDDAHFLAGAVATSFIDDRPELLTARSSKDRGTKLLTWIADVTVNQPYGEAPSPIGPLGKLPDFVNGQTISGSKQSLTKLGPKSFAQALRKSKALAVTETTFRDAHQSLLATRVRTRDLVDVMPAVAQTTPQLLSVEAWGGATYDVALRFLGEDPWQRLESMRKALPNICIQMLLRGRNTVGYTPYPTSVTDAFIQEASSVGVDIFRIFDALNNVENMRPAIDSVLEANRSVAEVALCYSGNLLDPCEELYTLDYYLRLAEKIADAGAHIIAIKDMAGLLRAEAASILVTALRKNFDLPVHLHTHDTAGGQLATLLAASAAGVDAVDAASAAMAGTTSQPSLSALVAALENTKRDTGLSLSAVAALEPYWEAVRTMYRPFESGLPGPTGRVYNHEIPGGQLSNLRQQAIALGLSDRFENIENWYAEANRLLGRPTKVTPSSKVVGDLALHLAAMDVDPKDFEENPGNFDIPDSVIAFMNGELGDLPGGWPEPFRTKILKGKSRKIETKKISRNQEEILKTRGRERQILLNQMLFPGPAKEYEDVDNKYGDVSLLKTHDFLYGLPLGTESDIEVAPGVTLLVSIDAISEPDDHGVRTVTASLNGQMRPILVRDKSIEAEMASSEKADLNNAAHVAAPFAGVVSLSAVAGESVKEGQIVATIEAMKMEAGISANVAGTISRIAITPTQQVEAGDLILELTID